MVFAVRVIERPSVQSVVAYMLTNGPLNSDKVATTLLEVLDLVQSKGMTVRLVGCDGASTNLAAIKTLCGLGRGDISCEQMGTDPHFFEPKMENPLHPGEFIWFIVCSDHTMKRLVRCAYESYIGRKRGLMMPTPAGGQPFTWDAIMHCFTQDKANAECRRTPLRREHVYRDGFSDLRVCVALAILHPHVLAAIETQSSDLRSAGDLARAADQTQMLEYLRELKACFPDFFLNNKLSKARVRDVADLAPARRLYQYLR